MAVTQLTIEVRDRAEVQPLPLENDHRINGRFLRCAVVMQGLRLAKLKGIVERQREDFGFVELPGSLGRRAGRRTREEEQREKKAFHWGEE